jgi:hypothetical protein
MVLSKNFKWQLFIIGEGKDCFKLPDLPKLVEEGEEWRGVQANDPLG